MNNIRNSHKFYKKYVSSTNHKPVGLLTYISIISLFVLFLMSKIFEGHSVELNGIGKFYIQGRKITPSLDDNGNIKNLAINWGETFKYWKDSPEMKNLKEPIYCFNEHSNGVRYKFIWEQNKQLINKSVFIFKPSRTNKRNISKLIKEGKEYIIKS